jgi:H+/gluconate symporter-like permease
MTDNPRYGKRTTASGLQLTVGNAAGISAPFLYPTTDAPRYIKGHAVSLAMVAMAGIIYAIMGAYFFNRNKRRSAGKEDEKLGGKTKEQIAEMGDESPHFVYTY